VIDLDGMAPSRTGEEWTAKVRGNTLVWIFLPRLDPALFEHRAADAHEELLSMYDIGGMVTVVKREDPFTEDVFRLWQTVVESAIAAGVERWAAVAEGIDDISVQNKVSVDGLETYTTEDRDEAIRWAQS
jgi:hypothetical protein